MTAKKHVIIVGGGITGLAAAFYIQQEAKKGANISFTLVEGSSRLGGKIETIKQDGFVIERGPDSYLARKSIMTELIEAVGLKEELTANRTGQAYIFQGGKMHPIPEGAVMGIPTKWGPFASTRLFSMKGKARAAMDLVLPKRKDLDMDISIGHFFRRRLGHEVVERMIEPLLSGIYAGDIDKLSLQATFPQFHETEKKSRSLILGMKQSAGQAKDKPGVQKSGAFRTLKGGLSDLVEAIKVSLPSSQIWLGKKVATITQNEGSKYDVELEDGTFLSGTHVILTAPYQISKKLLEEEVFPEGFHDTLPTSVATVAMAFKKESVKFDLDGTGFLVARTEDYTITACTWTDRKWAHTAPEGHVLLRCYVGRASDQSIVFQSDEEILKIVLHDLKRAMGLHAEPEFYYVSRLVQSMPQYEVNHKKLLNEFRTKLASHYPGIYPAGAPYDGVGLPDCVASAKKAVDSILG